MSHRHRLPRLLCMAHPSVRVCIVVVCVAISGCYASASVLDHDDGGVDATQAADDVGPRARTDAFVLPIDARVSRACSASTPCANGNDYCDFGGGCGGAGAIGTCLETPICLAPTRGGVVCGCDGSDYLDACEAHAAGTNVSVGTGCAGAPASDRVAAATPACAPAGGPAWTFTIAGTDAACDENRPGLRITLNADLTTIAPGTAFDLGVTSAAGLAQSCPYGMGGSCFTLQGIVVVDSFDEGVGASITYGLVGGGGTRDAPIEVRALAHAVEITTWCGAAPICS
jgi:hypothetical protein